MALIFHSSQWSKRVVATFVLCCHLKMLHSLKLSLSRFSATVFRYYNMQISLQHRILERIQPKEKRLDDAGSTHTIALYCLIKHTTKVFICFGIFLNFLPYNLKIKMYL